jgi:hypothetical protein
MARQRSAAAFALRRGLEKLPAPSRVLRPAKASQNLPERKLVRADAAALPMEEAQRGAGRAAAVAPAEARLAARTGLAASE